MSELMKKRMDKIDILVKIYEKAYSHAFKTNGLFEIGNCSPALDDARDEGLKAVIRYIKTGRKN